MNEEDSKIELNDEDTNDGNGDFDDSLIICKNCQRENPAKYKFCQFCGQAFVETVKCSRCYKEVSIIYSFCNFCGAPMKSSNMESGAPLANNPVHSTMAQRPTSKIDLKEQIKERQKQAKIQSRQTTAKVFGIIFLVLTITVLLNIILSIAMITTSSYDLLIQMLLESGLEDVPFSIIIISILSFGMPPMIIFGVSSYGLLKPRNPERPWKSLFHVLRYLFLFFVVLITVLSIIAIIGWIFYNPTNIVQENQLFWLFYAFNVPIYAGMRYLYLIPVMVYVICIIFLVLPTIIKVIKKNRSKKIQKSTSDESLEDTTEEPFQDVIANKSKSTNTSSYQPMLIYSSKYEEFKAVKKRKGPMPMIFTRIKNTPLFKSMELLGLSMLISYVFIFLFGAFIETPDISEADPFSLVFSVAWAGVFEEISFRLILIGIPMILVVLIRYIIQQRIAVSDIKVDSDSNKRDKNFYIRKWGNQPKLTIKDVLLSFKGGYKIIEAPEWTLIGISSIIFGFAHWEKWTGSWPVWKIFQAGIAGFLLSYAFVRYGLESAIFIHLTNNVISSLALFYLEVPGTNWIGAITSLCTLFFLAIGIMKSTSIIINWVYRFKIIKYPPTDF